jgi:uncharacterized protein YbaR (Trm112 family)
MDNRLLALLVCPLCKGPLHFEPDAGHPASGELICRADRLAFPIRDGIPLMLEDQARSFDPEAAAELARRPVSLGDSIPPAP